MIAVSLDKTLDEAKQWSREFNATFPVVFDPKQETAQKYGVDSIPVTFAIDRTGTVVSGISGYDEEQLPALARELLRWKAEKS